MHNNFHFLMHLCPALNDFFAEAKTLEIYTQDKNELIFTFYSKKNGLIHLKAILQQHISCLVSQRNIKRKRKNSINLFEPLIEKHLLSVQVNDWDRSCTLTFQDDYQLQIQLYGNKGNVHLYHIENIGVESEIKHLESFKNAQQNPSFIPILPESKYVQSIPESFLEQLKEFKTKEDTGIEDEALDQLNYELLNQLPTLGKYLKSCLIEGKHFYIAKSNQKKEILDQLFIELNKSKTFIYNDLNKINLVVGYPPKQAYDTFDDPLEAINTYYTNFNKNHAINKLKTSTLSNLYKARKKSHTYIQKAKGKLSEIQKARPQSEIADIIMASLHSLNLKEKTFELFDFYQNKQIKISLKGNQTPQKYAESLYRKSKNIQKEIDNLNDNINSKTNQLNKTITHIEYIEQSTDYRSLQSYIKDHLISSKKTAEVSVGPLPYWETSEGGYTIFIGKNAKNNDVILRNHSHKNDIWLHAKDVAGSHVLIKNASGKTVPNFVKEKAAALAAGYSKVGKETVTPVIWTERKYVRKRKGDPAGMVVVEKERVLLVEPMKL